MEGGRGQAAGLGADFEFQLNDSGLAAALCGVANHVVDESGKRSK